MIATKGIYRGHLKQRYLLNRNDGGSKTLEHDDFSLNTIGTLGSVVSSFAATILSRTS